MNKIDFSEISDELLRMYVDEQKSLKFVVDFVSCKLGRPISGSPITRFLHEKNVYRKKPKKFDLALFHDEIVAMYCEQFVMPSKIAKVLSELKNTVHITEKTVRNYLAVNNILRTCAESSQIEERGLRFILERDTKCAHCEIEFTATNVQQIYCKRCQPEWWNKDRIRFYQLGAAEYNELLKIQNGECSICRILLSSLSKRKINIDHDHVTGNVRGILCSRCNNLLSGLDDEKFFTNALFYVENANVIQAKLKNVRYSWRENEKQATNLCSGSVYRKDCLDYLVNVPNESIDLIYVDPPFGTNSTQRLRSVKSVRGGKTAGFGGKSYINFVQSDLSYADTHDDYLNKFLKPAMIECHRILKTTGTLYLHLDWRFVHYAKVMLDSIFEKNNFLNHIIWSYNYGGRGRSTFPKKHDDILSYAKLKGAHKFNWNDIDKIPYKAPSLQKDPARAAQGQVPTDVWEMTIVPTNSHARTGWPSQKPRAIAERIIRASSDPGDIVLDFCCGSGTTLEAAHLLGRKWIGVDNSHDAIVVMKTRFQNNGILANFVE